MPRRLLMPFVAVFLVLASAILHAEGRAQAELRFIPADSAERNAGVWVDGQYVGAVKDLTGGNKLMLLPGEHQIVVRQAWYKDHVENVLLQPGEVHEMPLSLQKEPEKPKTDQMAEVKISVSPARAAVFVDNQFAGQGEEFSGLGKAMLITPGEHSLRIALPGYLPFETVLNLRPNQKLKIETELKKGSITEAGGLVGTQ